MLEWLWLIPALPYAGFLALALSGSRLTRKAVAVIGVGTIGLSGFITLLAGADFLNGPLDGHAYTQVLWTWMRVEGFEPHIAFYLDGLSLTMVLVITIVGFFIHLYSVEFMRDREGYSRFFAYMNLFVGSMLVLVLADNLLLLYLGWEGVGLSSYLLIGFWYKDPANGRAARKAFVVTRVGDTALAIGLFLILNRLGTLRIQAVAQRASVLWPVGSSVAVAAAALLLAGALGKSAQLPLQTWLPDAMVGPTPVSALIHAATMVTAGVYLIARTHILFALAPSIELAIAVIGAATLLLAGFSALVQTDIKRVLAYSTISQVGYMFLALGVGAWAAAIFHFFTHAFFKSLLFLGAGVVIQALHEEHNLFKMGGLRRQLPLVFWTFLAGAASLAALPLITAGYYSKDLILEQAWSSAGGSPWLWAAGIAGALLTSLYAFRMVFLVFFGEARGQAARLPGSNIQIPLVVLAAFSLAAGILQPGIMSWLQPDLPPVQISAGRTGSDLALTMIAGAVSLAGILLAYLIFLRRPELAGRIVQTPPGAALHRLWFAGWGFDWLYDQLFVQPYEWLARTNRDDFVDLVYRGLARMSEAFHYSLSWTENGLLRSYALAITIGAVILLAMVIFL